MLLTKKRIYFALLATQITLSAPLMATQVESLDLEGNGQLTSIKPFFHAKEMRNNDAQPYIREPIVIKNPKDEIEEIMDIAFNYKWGPFKAMQEFSFDDGNISKFPFHYYQRQDGDRLTLIHTGGYKVYDIQNNQNDVAVIGPLRPCIGIVVTDGVKLIAFHKHAINSLESLGKIIKENLDLSNRNNLYARIYTTKDDIEWDKNDRRSNHGGKTHDQEVVSIKNFLYKTIDIVRYQIPADLLDLRLNYGDNHNGRYGVAANYVAVRLNDVFDISNAQKQIKFTTINPYTEDVFGYKGTQITEAEAINPKDLPQMQQKFSERDFTKVFIPYDKIDANWVKDGITSRRIENEEKKYFMENFGKPLSGFFNDEYNSVNYYPLS